MLGWRGRVRDTSQLVVWGLISVVKYQKSAVKTAVQVRIYEDSGERRSDIKTQEIK